jgi:hypothetical protein
MGTTKNDQSVKAMRSHGVVVFSMTHPTAPFPTVYFQPFFSLLWLPVAMLQSFYSASFYRLPACFC